MLPSIGLIVAWVLSLRNSELLMRFRNAVSSNNFSHRRELLKDFYCERQFIIRELRNDRSANSGSVHWYGGVENRDDK